MVKSENHSVALSQVRDGCVGDGFGNTFWNGDFAVVGDVDVGIETRSMSVPGTW